MLVGFFLAADWALVIVINKRMLAFVHPLPLNLLLRLVTIVGLLCMTVPLTAFEWWDLSFALTPEAAGYIAISAVVTWIVAFNAYYYALRGGRASVVAPILATDPIWAALFSPIILGTVLDPLVVVGLVVATAGVVLLARWMSEESGELLEAATTPVPAAPAAGAAAPDGARTAALGVIVLSLVAAAGWGLGPVIIELAENANGGASAGMMVGSQALGAAAARGHHAGPAQARSWCAPSAPIGGGASSCCWSTAGVLEAVFAVLYYLIIEAIGAVLTLLITATSPVFAIIGGAIFLKEPVGKRLAIAAAVTIGGVVIATAARDGLRDARGAAGGVPPPAAPPSRRLSRRRARRSPPRRRRACAPRRRRAAAPPACVARISSTIFVARSTSGTPLSRQVSYEPAHEGLGQLVLALAQEDPRLLGAEEVTAGPDRAPTRRA